MENVLVLDSLASRTNSKVLSHFINYKTRYNSEELCRFLLPRKEMICNRKYFFNKKSKLKERKVLLKRLKSRDFLIELIRATLGTAFFLTLVRF